MPKKMIQEEACPEVCLQRHQDMCSIYNVKGLSGTMAKREGKSLVSETLGTPECTVDCRGLLMHRLTSSTNN